MFSYNDKISIRQFQALLILDTLGTGVAIMPRLMAEFAGSDGWICVIAALILALFYTLIIAVLGKRIREQSFVEFTKKMLSKPIGVLISLLFVAKIVLQTAFELRLFCEVVRQTMLQNTPFIVICAFMLLVSAYAAAKGYETRARLGEILIFIVLVPLVIVFAVAAFQVDYSNLLPVFNSAPIDVLKGGFRGSFFFSTVEFCMIAFPYLNTGKKAVKGVLVSTLTAGIIMIAITVITIARFGPINVTLQMWPVIEMMDSLNLPGAFLERQGALMMSFWIVSVFSIVSAGLFFSSLLLKDIVKKGRHFIYIIIALLAILGLSFLPGNLAATFEYMNILYYIGGGFFSIFLPILLLLISSFRRPSNV